ncbi:MAG: hypothetical protein HUK21_05275 [Fibrobacteraceae bacterium]|nr:hypothetical protein [Fibrobacteraceae bacterium]
MKKFTIITTLSLLISNTCSFAITLKELKKYRDSIKTACHPDEGCDEGNRMVQPSFDEIEKMLGSKGVCRSSGTVPCKVWKDKECEKDDIPIDCDVRQNSDCFDGSKKCGGMEAKKLRFQKGLLFGRMLNAFM